MALMNWVSKALVDRTERPLVHRSARSWRRLAGPHAAALTYHRVVDLTCCRAAVLICYHVVGPTGHRVVDLTYPRAAGPTGHRVAVLTYHRVVALTCCRAAVLICHRLAAPTYSAWPVQIRLALAAQTRLALVAEVHLV